MCMNMEGEGNAYTCLDTYAGSREMKMQIGMEERPGAGLFVYMVRYTYAEIRERKMQMEKEVRNRSRMGSVTILPD